MNDIYSELAAHALQNVRQALSDLRVVIASSQEVRDVFPLWDDLRTVSTEAAEVSDAAARRCDELQEHRR